MERPILLTTMTPSEYLDLMDEALPTGRQAFHADGPIDTREAERLVTKALGFGHYVLSLRTYTDPGIDGTVIVVESGYSPS